MTIEQLLKNIQSADFNMEKELQVKKYLSLEEKKLIAKGIIYECTKDVDGFVKVDSVQQHLSYIKFMIKYHTNLDYSSEYYDILCSTEYCNNDLMTAIFETFEKDAHDCKTILNLMINDLMQENSIEFVLLRFLSSVKDMMSNKIDELNFDSIIPQGFDVEKFNKFLNTYVK